MVARTRAAAPQDLPKQLDDAAKREVLNQRMGPRPHNAGEIARRTRDEDLYFSPITDRRAPGWQRAQRGAPACRERLAGEACAKPARPLWQRARRAATACMGLADG